eukprot:5440536-Pleurochrysis_carterae.AAC.1
MHVLSLSELRLEVAITAVVPPAMGSQKSITQQTIKELANTCENQQIKTDASDCNRRGGARLTMIMRLK